MRGLRGKKENGGVGDSEDGDGDSGDSGDESGSESGSESEDLGGRGREGLEAFEGNREECKLVLVVRTDLGMGKGMLYLFFFFYNPLLFFSGVQLFFQTEKPIEHLPPPSPPF